MVNKNMYTPKTQNEQKLKKKHRKLNNFLIAHKMYNKY